jgi:hypothetical protein
MALLTIDTTRCCFASATAPQWRIAPGILRRGITTG